MQKRQGPRKLDWPSTQRVHHSQKSVKSYEKMIFRKKEIELRRKR